ncbi:MAG: nitrile hydratase subunit beta [Geminicoccaceae bacterium]|nr:nitrile hydratase subunit beta [Geminicoccaceae bacterium]
MPRRHHDMGGLPAGPVGTDEHAHAPWEKKVDAILRLLSGKGIMTVDELRRGIEEIGPDAYDRLSYYERWITSITNNLLEKRVIGVSELGEAMQEAQSRHAQAAGSQTQ